MQFEPGVTTFAAIVRLSAGNPGALTVLTHLVENRKSYLGLEPLGAVAALDLVGSRLWVLFKDICGHDLGLTAAVLAAVAWGLTERDDVVTAVDGAESGLRTGGGFGLDPDACLTKVRAIAPGFAVEKDK